MGRRQHRNRLETEAFCWLGAILLACALPRPAAADDVQIPGYWRIDLRRNTENHMLVHTRVNGVEATFGVDTGAPLNAVDSANWLKFNLEPIPPTMGYPRQVRLMGRPADTVLMRSFQAGPVSLGNVPAVLMNFAFVNTGWSFTGKTEHLDGLIGAEFMSRRDAILDCGACRLFLRNGQPLKASVAMDLAQAGFVRVGMQVQNGHLLVPCEIDGQTCRMIVDTGAFGTMLDSRMIAQLGLHERKLPMRSDNIMGIRGQVSAFQPGSFTIGPVAIHAERLGITDLEGILGTDAAGAHPVAGLIGGEVLANQGAVVDFATLGLYLHPR